MLNKYKKNHLQICEAVHLWQNIVCVAVFSRWNISRGGYARAQCVSRCADRFLFRDRLPNAYD